MVGLSSAGRMVVSCDSASPPPPPRRREGSFRRLSGKAEQSVRWNRRKDRGSVCTGMSLPGRAYEGRTWTSTHQSKSRWSARAQVSPSYTRTISTSTANKPTPRPGRGDCAGRDSVCPRMALPNKRMHSGILAGSCMEYHGRRARLTR